MGAMARRMQREVVVLPQPLSPTRPSVSPSLTKKLTSSTARTLPIVLREEPLLDREVLAEVPHFQERRGAGARHADTSAS